MNLNKVILIGRVTKNPELRKTTGGTSVASFSMATNKSWTDKNKQKQDEVEFHNLIAWGRTAEVASQFLAKGQLVSVEGRLKTRKWEDKQKVTHYTTEIIVEAMQLGPKPNYEKARQEKEDKALKAEVDNIPVIDLGEEPSQEIPF